MSARNLRIVFAGTPEFAAVHLGGLLQKGFNIVSAYSQPDRPSGRGKKLLPGAVKGLALAHDIPVLQPAAFTPAAQAELAALRPDIMIVVAYGLLLPAAILSLPRFGCINVHASLLPRWRGAAPIERAILAGDRETGISIMQMDEGLDTGAVLGAVTTPIQENDNSRTLTLRLQELGCLELLQVLEEIAGGTAVAVPQRPELACYAHKLKKEEAEIDWHRSARHIHDQVRAFYPRSPAWCLHQGQRVRILETHVLLSAEAGVQAPAVSSCEAGTVVKVAGEMLLVACEPGIVAIRKVQLEGKNPVTITELRNGRPDFFHAGTVLASAVSHDRA